jgi:hypothetical protein
LKGVIEEVLEKQQKGLHEPPDQEHRIKIHGDQKQQHYQFFEDGQNEYQGGELEQQREEDAEKSLDERPAANLE